MKQLKLFFLCLLLSTSIFASTPSAPHKLAELLNRFTTFQANFTQVTRDAHQQIMQKSAGKMMLMRPGKFRFETQKPNHQIVITNGNTLWVYDVDLQQATEQSIQNTPMNPAKLLSGNVDDLLKQFQVSMHSHQNNITFILMPLKSDPAFRSATIVFHHNTLYRMQIQTNVEQTSTFDFSKITVNKTLPADLFEFHAPKGVDVLK